MMKPKDGYTRWNAFKTIGICGICREADKCEMIWTTALNFAMLTSEVHIFVMRNNTNGHCATAETGAEG